MLLDRINPPDLRQGMSENTILLNVEHRWPEILASVEDQGIKGILQHLKDRLEQAEAEIERLK